MYDKTTTIMGPSRGSAGAFYQWALKQGCARPAEVLAYLTTVYTIAPKIGMRAEIVVGQSVHETSDADTGAPWSSYWWVQRLNPAGAGITGDPQQDAVSPAFASGADAARYQMTHLWLYARGTSLPAELKRSDDPRWNNAVNEGYAGKAPTLAGLDGKWAVDPQGYATKIVKHLNALDNAGLLTGAPTTDTSAEAPKDTTVTTYTTTVPGLPGAPLVTDYPINIKLIPKGNTYQRPGIKAEKPRRSVQHGTGNPNSMAAGEIAWLVDQQAGGGQVSFHATSDDLGVWIGVPADEVSWQAADGAGPGNMNGFSCEMIENAAMWGNTARKNRAIFVTADFMGKVAARLDIAKPEQHYTFNYADPNRHDCPDKLRHVAGAWDAYVKQWNASKAAELARMAGGAATDPGTKVPEPTAIYAKPLPIPGVSDISTAANDTAPAVVSANGTTFFYVADVVEAIKDTPRLQWADVSNSKKVGPDIKKGERFIVTWMFRAGDGLFYYITPWNTRVSAVDTKRISDAPLAPSDLGAAQVA